MKVPLATTPLHLYLLPKDKMHTINRFAKDQFLGLNF